MSTTTAGRATRFRTAASSDGPTSVGNTMNGVVEVAVRPEGIGARDDQEVRVLARLDGRADARRGFLGRAQALLDRGVLAEGVVLDMDRRDSGLLERLHRAPDVCGIVEAGLGVGDYGHVDRVDDGARLLDELRQREGAGVGKRQAARGGRVAADVDALVAVRGG